MASKLFGDFTKKSTSVQNYSILQNWQWSRQLFYSFFYVIFFQEIIIFSLFQASWEHRSLHLYHAQVCCSKKLDKKMAILIGVLINLLLFECSLENFKLKQLYFYFLRFNPNSCFFGKFCSSQSKIASRYKVVYLGS